MQRIVYPVLFAVSVLAGACTKRTSDTSSPAAVKTQDMQLLHFAAKEFKKETSLRCNPCPEVWISIPVADGDTVVAKRINDAVFETTRKVLGREDEKAADYDELLASFIGQYEEVVKKFPDHAGAAGWTGTVKGSVLRQDSALINLKLETYTMTGGAHGYGSRLSLLFDPATGRALSIPDVVGDTAALTRVAEAAFRKKFAIPGEKPINSTVFTFENDRFALPRNIFFTKEGMLLYYNAYEIGPYSEGSKELLLPYEQVRSNISGKFDITSRFDAPLRFAAAALNDN